MSVAPPVVVWQAAPPPNSSPTKPTKRGARGRRAGAHHLTLHELGIGRSQSLAPSEFAAGGGAGGADPKGSTGSAVLDRLRDAGVDTSIYDRIEEALTYPEELARAKIHGDVRAALTFDNEGRYQREQSQLLASSPYLRVLVARTLRDVFREPLPERMLRGRSRKNVRCRFEFRLVGELIRQARVEADRGGLVDGLMVFRRNHREALVWKQGRFLFTPLGLAVDVEGLAQDAVEATKPTKAQADPLERYRRDPEWARG